MTRKKRNWLIFVAATFGVIVLGLAGAGWYLSERLEPFVRAQTIAYLEQRFDGEVSLAKFDVSMPVRDPLKVLLERGRGAHLRVKASGIGLKQKGAREGHPLLRIAGLTFQIDLSKVLDDPAIIDEVHVEGLRLALPPKGERQFARPAESPAGAVPGSDATRERGKQVRVGRIIADGAKLTILPKDLAKAPLEFDLYELTLESAGSGVAMRYTTKMKNAKPPGVIDCRGTFGPFNPVEPGESPLTGDYVFRGADLAVFKGIAGKLDSTGKFSGKLNEILVDGETVVPDFRLPAVNQAVKLSTRFHAIVDGTNGNTRLQPVTALLGRSAIRCQGEVARYPGDNGKTVDLSCAVKDGVLDEMLRLAVKGERPPMTGKADFNLKILVPPEKAPYAEKLRLSGPFKLKDAMFTNPKVQAQLDDMSRRAQGKPKDLSITGMTSYFEGRMRLERQLLTLNDLVFVLPGASVRLDGKYDMKADEVDFRGQVRTEARLSQMMKTGWKRLALKVVDPIFAKHGAGAQFSIAITGAASSPKFGLERKAK